MTDKTIFWDVDTQYDFMADYGRVYVPGAKEIWEPLKKLTQFARDKGYRIFGSVDDHMPDDPEISRTPDRKTTFPPHCMKGSPGTSKIEATMAKNPYWVERWAYDPAMLQRKVLDHAGEVYILKTTFDVFSNPNTELVLDLVAPEKIVLYGVALDRAVAHTVRGMLARGKHALYVVEDATRSNDPAAVTALGEEWKGKGVRFVTTADVTEKGVLDG
jgi:nicotinamidase-related amidase